jgi:hypothetical protein
VKPGAARRERFTRGMGERSSERFFRKNDPSLA